MDMVLNSITVGEFGPKDISIQVTGLKPGHYYNIRVIATNSSSFSTVGPLIRLRTIPATSNESDISSKTGSDGVPDEKVNDCEPAGIKAGRTQFAAPASAPVQQVVKESPTTQPSSKKGIFGRRVSPLISTSEPSSLLSSRATSVDEDDSEEAIQRLTEQLDRLRREQHDTDKQVDDEDREHLASVADLTKDRDNLRLMLKEKEESTAELKKNGSHLEKISRAAQTKRNQQERVLRQKRVERDKIKTDIEHWDEEIAQMRQENDQVTVERDQIESTASEDLAAVRKLIAEDQSVIKALEEEIRITGVQIKSMEKLREHADENGDDAKDHNDEKTSRDSAWDLKVQAMQAQVMTLWQTMQQVKPIINFSPGKIETDEQKG